MSDRLEFMNLAVDDTFKFNPFGWVAIKVSESSYKYIVGKDKGTIYTVDKDGYRNPVIREAQ